VRLEKGESVTIEFPGGTIEIDHARSGYAWVRANIDGWPLWRIAFDGDTMHRVVEGAAHG
jgi:hypothetical protein